MRGVQPPLSGKQIEPKWFFAASVMPNIPCGRSSAMLTRYFAPVTQSGK
jgi:hypothetical protein